MADKLKQFATWWTATIYHKEQLEDIISSKDLKSYAYILHDKDTDIKTGELKKPHWHILVQFGRNLRGSWFKQFWTDDLGRVFPEPVKDAENVYNYLIHDTPICRKEGKYLYDPSERISTIEKFDPKEEEISESDMLFADIIALLDKGMTRFEFLRKSTKRIHSMRNISGAIDWLGGEYNGPETTEPEAPVDPSLIKKAIATVKPNQSDIFDDYGKDKKPADVKPQKKKPEDLISLPDDDPLYDIF